MNFESSSVELLLTEVLAVDQQLVGFLKNRKVPVGNLYWGNEEKYLSEQIRYLSIPLWIELFDRVQDVSLQTVVQNMPIMEQLLHNTELEEQKLISFKECIRRCGQIDKLSKRGKANPKCRIFIENTIKTYPKNKSLRRGNALLYYFLLYFDDDTLNDLKKSIYIFLDFIICGCIWDDLVDAHTDAENDELNILNELGGTIDALADVKSIYSNSLDHIRVYYPEIEQYCEDIFSKSAMIYLDKLKIW